MAEQGLQRELGLSDIVLFGVGGIVGAGIYAIIGEAAAYGGSLLWASFLVAALVAFLTAGTYAELVSRYPDAGGSFEYVRQAFGIRWAAVASVAMLFTGVVAAGAIAISFSSYLSRLLDVPTVWTTIGVIAAMGAVNAVGAAEASWFNILATAVTLGGLAAVVVVAVPDIGSVDLLGAGDTTPLALGIGGALIFFSFIGFEDLVKLAEETRDPRRTLPRGMVIAALVVLVVYIAVAIAAVSALGSERLADSPGPLAEIMRAEAGAAWSAAIVVVALFATSKTILSNLLGASRLAFDVARDTGAEWLERVNRVNGVTGTPMVSILLVTLAAIGFGAIGNLRVVAAVGNLLVMVVFLTVNAALLKIRGDGGDRPPFVLPGSIGPYPVTTVAAIVGTIALLALNVLALFGVGRPV
ncbi:MAG: APC family permease [Acidimicrobiia bacterium]|nr:APC family permease [Acidimicrobiia bacterium]